MIKPVKSKKSETHALEVVVKPSKKRRLTFGFIWVGLWPLIVMIPAIAVFVGGLYLAQQIIGGPEEFNKQYTSALQIATFAGVCLLVVVLLVLKRVMRKRKRLFFRVGGSVLGVYIWLGMFVSGWFLVGIGYNPSVAKPPVKQDSNLVNVITAIGGDTTKLQNVSVSYVDGYDVPDRAGEYIPYTDLNGDFSYGTITIKKGLEPDAEKVIVAHEYLHHIWETQIDPATLHDLTSQLMTMYGDDDGFKNRVAQYSDTNMLLPTELFSFYCTESSDQYLTTYVAEQCSTYINRSTLRFYR